MTVEGPLPNHDLPRRDSPRRAQPGPAMLRRDSPCPISPRPGKHPLRPLGLQPDGPMPCRNSPCRDLPCQARPSLRRARPGHASACPDKHGPSRRLLNHLPVHLVDHEPPVLRRPVTDADERSSVLDRLTKLLGRRAAVEHLDLERTPPAGREPCAGAHHARLAHPGVLAKYERRIVPERLDLARAGVFELVAIRVDGRHDLDERLEHLAQLSLARALDDAGLQVVGGYVGTKLRIPVHPCLELDARDVHMVLVALLLFLGRRRQFLRPLVERVLQPSVVMHQRPRSTNRHQMRFHDRCSSVSFLADRDEAATPPPPSPCSETIPPSPRSPSRTPRVAPTREARARS